MMSRVNSEHHTKDALPQRFQRGALSLTGIVLGLLVVFTLLCLPPPPGMQLRAWKAAAVASLMAVWWLTEAIPLAATALVPIALFPLLGVLPLKEATAPYANPLIFLFMGGFMIALAMERWNLHRRIALNILSWTGSRQDALIGGFMLATAGLSMWVSNTATAVMMLPIAISVIPVVSEAPASATHGGPVKEPFAIALLLGIAYSASIGGLGTLIGTPPNALLAGLFLEKYGYTIGFAQWMLVGVPLAVLMLLFTWALLTRFLYPLKGVKVPGAEEMIRRQLQALGPVSRGERTVAMVFVATALLWMFRPLFTTHLGIPLSDPSIAIGAALLLFVIPVDVRRGEFAMNWHWAQRLPWGVLLLFGGGLSLAEALSKTGLARWIGESMSVFSSWNALILVVLVVSVIIFLTELTSNTATTASFLPVLAALAQSVGENPLLFAVPATIAASCAFMMPVATPPNTIVFGSGKVTIAQMARAGLLLNIAGIVLVTALTYSLIMLVFDIKIGVSPPWAVGD
jgi:sodium-dependent dicarboxylate transporter 2/3/5